MACSLSGVAAFVAVGAKGSCLLALSHRGGGASRPDCRVELVHQSVQLPPRKLRQSHAFSGQFTHARYRKGCLGLWLWVYRADVCAALGIDAIGKLVDFVDRELRKEVAKYTSGLESCSAHEPV